ncbi:MAG: hypothetical protein ACRDJF_12425 [Actinomycetota bacterium]
MRSTALAAAALAIALMGTACGANRDTADTPPASRRPASTAKLQVLEPAPGAVLSGSTTLVKLQLQGAKLVPQTTKRIKPDEGHIHLSLDGLVVSMTSGLEQEIPITKGTHLLQAEFVAGDHFPFNPKVVTNTTFTVQ